MLRLSLRKYAATIGVTHTAIAKAIKAGHIVKGWDLSDKKIIVEFADNEWGNFIREKNRSFNNVNSKGLKESNFDESYLHKEDYTPLNGNMTFSEARRRKEISNAEIARIAALREQGIYVEKQKVYFQLFEFGKCVSTALLAIPDRIVDELMEKRTRYEAHTLLLNTITQTLELLDNSPVL